MQEFEPLGTDPWLGYIKCNRSNPGTIKNSTWKSGHCLSSHVHLTLVPLGKYTNHTTAGDNTRKHSSRMRATRFSDSGGGGNRSRGRPPVGRPLTLWTEWQMLLKILPCLKLRLRAVTSWWPHVHMNRLSRNTTTTQLYLHLYSSIWNISHIKYLILNI